MWLKKLPDAFHIGPTLIISSAHMIGQVRRHVTAAYLDITMPSLTDQSLAPAGAQRDVDSRAVAPYI